MFPVGFGGLWSWYSESQSLSSGSECAVPGGLVMDLQAICCLYSECLSVSRCILTLVGN